LFFPFCSAFCSSTIFSFPLFLFNVRLLLLFAVFLSNLANSSPSRCKSRYRYSPSVFARNSRESNMHFYKATGKFSDFFAIRCRYNSELSCNGLLQNKTDSIRILAFFNAGGVLSFQRRKIYGKNN